MLSKLDSKGQARGEFQVILNFKADTNEVWIQQYSHPTGMNIHDISVFFTPAPAHGT
jgi:hypothetical protein